MSIITTGINIVATGVNQAIDQVQRFGKAFNQTSKEAQAFANGYNRAGKQIEKTSSSLSVAMGRNWRNEYRAALNAGVKDTDRFLRQIKSEYDRTFREIGNRYQSMVMGSVALSMSGIGLKNMGGSILGGTKTALDQARDYETVLKQIQFYGKRLDEEMDSISKKIFDISYDLPVLTTEIANSVLSAQKLGYDEINDAMKMAEEASKIQFMSLGKLDGEESLKYISHIRKLTGYAIEDTDKLTDKLTMASDVSAASIDSLWKTIQSSRTSFDALNTDVDTFLTLAGVMSDRLQPRQAGMALSSFGGGVMMGEKAAREDRGTRGAYYKQLQQAMGGKTFDDYGGDTLAYISDVATKSREIWTDHAERMGILQSIFGKSALDLFMAVDAYTSETGRSMVEMREEIRNADGHAQALIDTIMNGSYGTEMRLKTVIEQFQILFGTAIRPAFNAILDGLTFVIGKVNQFLQQHPRIAKVLGYGVGIAGLMLVATGATMLFVGGLLALIASIGNVATQLVRNIRVLDMLAKGYNTAGEMIYATIRRNLLMPMKMLGLRLLKFTGITFFLWLAWKNDFFRMRTTFNEWREGIGKGLKESQTMFELYSQNSVKALNEAFIKNQNKGGLEGWIANTWTKARMLWDGIKDIWSDGTISVEKYQMLSDAGLIGTVEKVYEIKTAVLDFWNGFQDGLKDGIKLLKKFIKPLLVVWDWVSDKVLGLFQKFGYFENVNKGIGSQWEQWGQKAGYLVGSVIAIRVGLWAWLKAIKLMVSPFKLLWKFGNGLFKVFDKLKNLKIGEMFKKIAKLPLPKTLQNLMRTANYSYHKKRSGYARQGAHSQLPYARQVIDPTTGKPKMKQIGNVSTPEVTYQKKWWQRNKKGRTLIPTGDGKSYTMKGRGITGRLKDLWLGQQYYYEDKVDKRGNKYRTTRMTGVDGKPVARNDRFKNGKAPTYRTGRGLKGIFSAMNQVNFQDAGMDYASSVGQKGHKSRSIKAGAKGWWNRQQRIRLTAGSGYADDVRGVLNRGGGRGGKGFNIGNLFKGATKGVGKVAGGLGKGLLKGLGNVVTKGLPLLFKGALRAIPFVGWALMAWDAISLIWGNWDAIKNGAKVAWDWIKGIGIQVWDWIKVKAGEIWDGIVSVAQGAWNWILGIAQGVWNWILGIAQGVWNGIVSFATGVWNTISGIASGVWNAILGFATSVWDSISGVASTIWEGITGFAETMWNNMITFAQSSWDSVTGVASGVIDTIKGFVNGIFDGLFDKAVEVWGNIKKWFAENPITQAVKAVGNAKSGDGKKGSASARTGEWYVPRDNMLYNLHQGEMVLKRNEAQILRNMVGSDNNSISRYLLEDRNKGEGPNVSVKAPTKKILKPRITQQQQPHIQQADKGGDTTIQVTFEQGAIQVANASPSEMKKGAKQMFEEFKRMVELDNMKNYKPARPRTR